MTTFTKEQLYTHLAAVLTTLLELHPNSVAESTLYLHFGTDMEKYKTFRRIATTLDLVVVHNHRMSLSGKGMELAKELQQVLDERKAANGK